MQVVEILRENLARVLEPLIDDAVNLLVDPGLGLVGKILRPSDGMAEEDLFLIVAVSQLDINIPKIIRNFFNFKYS